VAAPFHTIDSKLLDILESLEVIILHGSGYDKVDVEYASTNGILIFNIPDYIAVTVAEHALALALSLTRKTVGGTIYIKDGLWGKGMPPKQLRGIVLRDKKIGIVGLGRIGSEVARLLKAFNCRVYYWNRRKKPEVEHALLIEYLPLKQLFKTCDIIIVSVALTKDTWKLIDRNLIFSMKRGAYLINVSRGGIIDENALIEALKEGVLGGAGLDVYSVEPLPPDHPLLSLSNVVLTPHIGGFSEYSASNTSRYVYELIRQLYIEKILPEENLVNRAALGKARLQIM